MPPATRPSAARNQLDGAHRASRASRARAALALALLAAGCGGEAARARGRGPNVLLVVIDTLRADHLSTYGYPLPTSPALDELAAHATVFDDCRAPAPWTTPSTASILSGLHPLRHGSVRHGSALSPDVWSLAEALSERGYATWGISFNHNVSRTSGFDQGFERFEDFGGRSTAYPDVSEMVASVAALLDQRDGGPFFLYLQPMNAHGPYVVPEGEARVHGRPPAQGFRYYGPTMKGILKEGELLQRERVDGQQLQSLVEQYDAAVRHVTDAVGEVLDELRRRDLYDDTLVVITSDHGEELFEHGGFSHGYSLHREVLHVPLVVKLPGQRQGARIATPVSLLDVHPTVLAALGLPVAPGLDGVPRLPEGGGSGGPGLLGHVDWEKRCVASSLEHDGWKVVHVESNYEGLRDVLRLYDLRADRAEQHDVSARHPDVLETLGQELERRVQQLRRHPLPPPPDVSAGLDEATLRELGYL